MFSKRSQKRHRRLSTRSQRLAAATLLAAGIGTAARAQSVPFPTYTVGENKDAAQGPGYPSTLPTLWVVSSGQIITPVGTQVYLGTTTRAKAVALNPTGNHTAAVLQMGAPQAITVFNTQTGAVLQRYCANGGKDRDGSTNGITYSSDGKYLLFSQDGSNRVNSIIAIASVGADGLLSDYAQVPVPADLSAAHSLTTVTCFPQAFPVPPAVIPSLAARPTPAPAPCQAALQWPRTIKPPTPC